MIQIYEDFLQLSRKDGAIQSNAIQSILTIKYIARMKKLFQLSPFLSILFLAQKLYFF